jgi:predicted NUDIX family NTP pyrophosphohydrolase
MAAGLAVIDAAPETINGDTATVAVDPKGQPKTLKKIDGQWRIPIGEVFSGVDEAAVQQRLDDMADLSKMMGQTADEINAGKYKTPKDAEEAIDSRIMASTMRQAATQPGTAPPDAPSTEPAPMGM